MDRFACRDDIERRNVAKILSKNSKKTKNWLKGTDNFRSRWKLKKRDAVIFLSPFNSGMKFYVRGLEL